MEGVNVDAMLSDLFGSLSIEEVASKEKITTSDSYSKKMQFFEKTDSLDERESSVSSSGAKIYVLELVEGKYYVGESLEPMARIKNHCEGNGSVWTKLYPVVKLVEMCDFEDFKEDMITKQYMKKFGVENVRGGQYCQVILPETQLAELERCFAHNDKRCLRCGRTGHWVLSCFATTHVNGKDLSKTTTVNGSAAAKKNRVIGMGRGNVAPSDAKRYCTTCFRTSHWKKDCYATFDAYGHLI